MDFMEPVTDFNFLPTVQYSEELINKFSQQEASQTLKDHADKAEGSWKETTPSYSLSLQKYRAGLSGTLEFVYNDCQVEFSDIVMTNEGKIIKINDCEITKIYDAVVAANKKKRVSMRGECNWPFLFTLHTCASVSMHGECKRDDDGTIKFTKDCVVISNKTVGYGYSNYKGHVNDNYEPDGKGNSTHMLDLGGGAFLQWIF